MEGTSVPQIIVGDGAQLCYDALTAAGIPAVLAPEPADAERLGRGPDGIRTGSDRPDRLPGELVPIYHRLSQAERERLEREEAAKKQTT